jgi:NarL family two-component system response regulator LiaR
MRKTILLYGTLLASATFLLEWVQYRYVSRLYPAEVYLLLTAVAFGALGLWAGTQLVSRRRPADFERNVAALRALGITEREYAVLELLAAGHSNKEIARQLCVSPNTVKTHVSNLFGKLDVGRRTQAVGKARDLGLIR